MNESYKGMVEELNNFLKVQKKPCFKDVLDAYSKSKGIPITLALKDANLDRRFVSKFKNRWYRPKKSTVLALCIGLHLSLEEAENLLNCAGFALSFSIIEDLIFMFYIRREIYDIEEINIVLYDYGCNILGSIPRE